MQGIVPFENCEQFAFLSCDCSAPMNIKCECCTHCFGDYRTYEENLPCPSSELSFVFDSHVNNFIYLYVQNIDRQQILTAYYYATPETQRFSSCISPTDCFTLTSRVSFPFSMHVDGTEIKKMSAGRNTISFGYVSENLMKLDTCDDVVICDKIIPAMSSKRTLLNLVTRFNGMDNFEDQNSAHHLSLCWWLDDLDHKPNDDLHDDALIQRYILSLLYYSTKGAKWVRKDNWLTKESECSWYGVSCDVYPGVISKIDLSSNNLGGSIPSELGQLRTADELIMMSNDLHGTIPKQIVNMKSLNTLTLSSNNITGTIYSELKFLKNLKKLDLSENKLSGNLPVELSLLKQIEVLDLSNNNVDGKIPHSFSNLEKLRILSLRSNVLRGKIDMIYNLTNLGECVSFFQLNLNLFSSYIRIFGLELQLL